MQVLMKRYKILDYLLVGDENYSKELRKTRVDNINPSKHPSSQVLFYISWATEWKKVPVHAHILTARYIVTDARAECIIQILNGLSTVLVFICWVQNNKKDIFPCHDIERNLFLKWNGRCCPRDDSVEVCCGTTKLKSLKLRVFDLWMKNQNFEDSKMAMDSWDNF